MPDATLIFAAGLGTRMRPLTDNQPKPLIRVAGRALIDHAFDLTQGVASKVVINAHYKAEQLQAHFAGRSDAHILVEQPDILDTGGGLKNALPLLGKEPVFTLNSDAVWLGPNPLQQLASHWDPTRMDGLLMLVPFARTVAFTRHGDFSVDTAGRLSKDENGLVYTGAQIIKTDLLAKSPKGAFSMHYLWDKMLAAGTLHGIEYRGSWADVGTPEGIAKAEAMLDKRDV